MPKHSPPNAVAQAKSRVGVAARLKDEHALVEARRNLAEAKIAAYVEKAIADAPPLTGEQRARLATLLDPQSGGVSDAVA